MELCKNVYINSKIASLQYSLINRLFDDKFHEWKLIPLHLTKSIFAIKFNFHSNLDSDDSKILTFPSFYKQLFHNWRKYLSSSVNIPSSILSQPIWHNKNIEINSKSIYIGEFSKQNIFLCDLFNPFVPNAPFIYPLKASENLTVFCCFQEVEKESIGNEWVSTENEFKMWDEMGIRYNLKINLISNGDKFSIQFPNWVKSTQRKSMLNKNFSFFSNTQLSSFCKMEEENKSPILLWHSYTRYLESSWGIFYWLLTFFTVNTTDCHFWLL